MGNINTSLVNQASASTCCLVVERQSAFPWGNRGIDTSKPTQLNVDDVLWTEVVEAIDPLARRLNTGFCTALVLYIATIVILVGLCASGVFRQYNDDMHGLSFCLFLLLVASQVGYIPFWLGAIIFVYEVQNRRVDNQIKQLMEGWKYRFEDAGYSLDYRTQHTGACKLEVNGHQSQQSERILAFVPIESATLASTTNTGTSLASKEAAFSDEPIATNIDIEMNAGLASTTQGLSLVDQLQQDDKLFR
mmetsp:Transcript_31434/g.92161  ORF Transcript_31434/g.92161 Transcript_31434/m.92161 type:complete len:248 (-) Transcript_31434:216-959(-)